MEKQGGRLRGTSPCLPALGRSWAACTRRASASSTLLRGGDTTLRKEWARPKESQADASAKPEAIQKVDFHVHTTASFDSRIAPADLLEIVPAAGLDAIAVTDHNALEGAVEIAALDPPFGVIVGEEILSAEGEIIGLFLTERIQSGLSPEATIARIREQGGLVVVPHPFDRFRSSAIDSDALERIGGLLDAVEGLNGRNLIDEDDRTAREWAAARDLPTIAGSDAHSAAEVGRVYTQLPEFADAEGLRAALREAVPHGRRSGIGVHLVTRWDKLRRRR